MKITTPNFLGRIFLTLAITCFVVTSAPAGVTFFSDLPSWEAAVAGANGPIDFEGIASDDSFVSYTSAVTISGVTFDIPDWDHRAMFVIGRNWYGYGDSVLSAQFDDAQVGSSQLTITLPEPVTALALNYRSLSEATADFDFNLSNGEAFSQTANNSSFAFLGFTTDDPFDQVSLQSIDRMNIDDLSYGAAVPEPVTSAVATGLGLLALGFWRKQWRARP